MNFEINVEILWQSWRAFIIGKRRSAEILEFAYSLEDNLFKLENDLKSGEYMHGEYRQFEVYENKRRLITVATVRDRVVHRLLYEYLVGFFDLHFIDDVWSSRKGKGLHGATKRAESFLKNNQRGYVWRMDVLKFFDSVSQEVLLKMLEGSEIEQSVIVLCQKIIRSYSFRLGIGLPIGNLTSQIFANIYLNAFDEWAKKKSGGVEYMRYGDDAIFLAESRSKIEQIRKEAGFFLKNELGLTINPKNDIIVPVKRGIKFLGCWVYPSGICLVSRTRKKMADSLSLMNMSSYSGLVIKQESRKMKNNFEWRLRDLL